MNTPNLLIIGQSQFTSNIKNWLNQSNYKQTYIPYSFELADYDFEKTDLVILLGSKGFLEFSVEKGKWLRQKKIPTLIIFDDNNYESYEKFRPTKPVGYFYQENLSYQDFIIILETTLNQIFLLKNQKVGLYLRDSNNVVNWVAFQDILWVRSDGNYCFVKTEDKKYVIRKSLKKIIKQLPAEAFIYTFRGVIVQVAKIEKIDLKNNTLFVKGEELPIGRKYKLNISQKLDWL